MKPSLLTQKFLMPQLSSAALQAPISRKKSNPVVAELHRAYRRLRVVWQIWQIDRRNAAAAKGVAYERAHLKAMEESFHALLAANKKRRTSLDLALMVIDTECL